MEECVSVGFKKKNNFFPQKCSENEVLGAGSAKNPHIWWLQDLRINIMLVSAPDTERKVQEGNVAMDTFSK